jgi:hypothetical protein
MIEVKSDHGIATIQNPLLPAAYAHVIHLDTLDASMRCVTRAAGEILERFYLPRGRRRSEQWQEAMHKHRDVRLGRGVKTYLDISTGKIRREIPQELAR